MTSDEKILNFLEGDLNESAEQSLFEELLHEPGLRASIRHFYEINAAIRNDHEAFSPPIEAESKLGLAFQTLALGGAESMATSANAGFITSVLLPKIGLVTSLVTAFFMGSILTHSFHSPEKFATFGGSTKGYAAIQQTDKSIFEENLFSNKAYLSNKLQSDNSSFNSGSFSNKNLATNDKVEYRTITKYVYLNRPQKPAIPNFVAKADNAKYLPKFEGVNFNLGNNLQPKNEIYYKAIQKIEAKDLQEGNFAENNVANNLSMKVKQNAPISMPLVIEEEESPKLISELRHQIQTNVSNSVAGSGDSKFYDDMVFGFYVNFLPTLPIGIETGVERYAQTLKVNSGDTIYIDQKPRYYWVGLSGRYYPFEQSTFNPYVQGTLGATSVGPLIRGRVGTDFEFSESIGFTFGLESSAMFYTFNRQNLFSGRWGATSGIKVSF